METVVKKNIDEFLTVMQHMHVSIKRLLEAGNYPLAMECLEQCQNYAIHFGQQVEVMEGKRVITVTLLEDYCELVYQNYEKIRCFLPVDANDIHNCLAMQMIRIGNSIERYEKHGN